MDYKFPKMDETESTNCCHMLINGISDINTNIIGIIDMMKTQNKLIEKLQEENKELRKILSPLNNLQ